MLFMPLIDPLFVLALMVTGLWLENINGKQGIFDHFLTPFPLGMVGLAILYFERHLA